MDDWIKRLITNIKDKIDILIRYKKLLLAAVILFCSALAVFLIPKTIGQFIQSKSNNDDFVRQINRLQTTQNIFSANSIYLTANSLASINTLSTSSENFSEKPAYSNGSSLVLVQKNALLTQSNPITFITQQPRTDIITYTVQVGDTPISIAASFGITTNTLLWANKLNAYSIIRPGDELIIPPVSGVIHRVKSGETISQIAKRYDAQSKDIIAFNELPANGTINIGDKIIVPDGQMPTPKPQRTYSSGSYASISGAGTGKSRSFPWGQCTWYVAQKRIVPWSGHAKSWLANAQAYGYQTGTAPQAGAIMVLSEGGWMGRAYGHVAHVESVKNGWITISEMNYRCLGCKSVRTLNIHDRRIRGYIY